MPINKVLLGHSHTCLLIWLNHVVPSHYKGRVVIVNKDLWPAKPKILSGPLQKVHRLLS
jgi:hypothetical protein